MQLQLRFLSIELSNLRNPETDQSLCQSLAIAGHHGLEASEVLQIHCFMKYHDHDQHRLQEEHHDQ